MKAIVIYYDGNEHKAALVETDIANSAMPHVYGLRPDYDIIAVIANPGKEAEVYIEEELQELGNG